MSSFIEPKPIISKFDDPFAERFPHEPTVNPENTLNQHHAETATGASPRVRSGVAWRGDLDGG
jgi:hypothetical protein